MAFWVRFVSEQDRVSVYDEYLYGLIGGDVTSWEMG
jgi:hypothetical protein